MASQESDVDAQNAKETDPLIGQTVGGRFVIKGRIARGGMACVYSATQTQVERPVAIKVLRPTWDGSVGTAADFRRRFLQEASILSRLQHPNLVTLLDYGQITEASGDHYYIAMEYLRGETLSRRFRHRGRLDVAQTIRIARQVGRGLREAHRQGFIHRDLKPSNIMLVPEDAENDIVKLIDFGIGKAVGSRALEQLRGGTSEQEEMTRVGLLLGSPRYMAPEQIRGDTVEPRTDLYGLGIVLYQALTGRLPFEGKSQMDLMLAHCSMPPPPLDDFLELPAPSLSELVADLLKKHPSERPTIDEFLARLANVEQDLFDSVGLAGPTLLGSRSSFPPSERRGSLRPPPPANWRRSSPPPPRLPSSPPRPSRSDNATVVVTGSLANPTGLAAPKPPDSSLLLAIPGSFEDQMVPPSLGAGGAASWPPASSLEPYLAPPFPRPVDAPPRRKRWAVLLVPVLGALLWLSLRPAPEVVPSVQTAPSVFVPPAAPTAFVLRLGSSPPAAVVKENGVVLGQTPLRLEIARSSPTAAPRQFSLERAGYSSYTHLQADSATDVDVVAELVRLPSAAPTFTRQRSRAKAATSLEGAPEAPVAATPGATPTNPKQVRGLDINLER